MFTEYSLEQNNVRNHAGAAKLWEGGDDGWALRAILDLVEGGDVRRLFSDAELLKLVEAEEEHERRVATGTHKHDGPGNASHTSRKSTEATRDDGEPFPVEEAPALDKVGQGEPGSPTASKGEVRQLPVGCELWCIQRMTCRSIPESTTTPSPLVSRFTRENRYCGGPAGPVGGPTLCIVE